MGCCLWWHLLAICLIAGSSSSFYDVAQAYSSIVVTNPHPCPPPIIIVPGKIHSTINFNNTSAVRFGTGILKHFPLSLSTPPKTHWPITYLPWCYVKSAYTCDSYIRLVLFPNIRQSDDFCKSFRHFYIGYKWRKKHCTRRVPDITNQ